MEVSREKLRLIEKLFNKTDLENTVRNGESENGYETEIKAILDRLDSPTSAEQVEEIIREVFYEKYDDRLNNDRYMFVPKLSSDVYRVLILPSFKRIEKIKISYTSPDKDPGYAEYVCIDGINEEIIYIDSPNKMPDRGNIAWVKEPFIYTNIIVPSEYIGPIMELCQNKRGRYKSMEYIDETRVNIHYHIPLSEIVYDFFDKLKSLSKGYASFDYEISGYEESNLVKMDILLNGAPVDALSIIVHKDFAYERGRKIVKKLKELIPRQMFELPIQASIGSKVIARETISAMRKNVLAKCYGGDVSRKRKLLEKQKEGKKRMKMVGSVEVPQEAFLAVLSGEDE